MQVNIHKYTRHGNRTFFINLVSGQAPNDCLWGIWLPVVHGRFDGTPQRNARPTDREDLLMVDAWSLQVKDHWNDSFLELVIIFSPTKKISIFFRFKTMKNNGLWGLMLQVKGPEGWSWEFATDSCERCTLGLGWNTVLEKNVFFIVYIHWYYTKFMSMFCTVALVRYHIHDLTISYGIASYHGGTTLINCLHVLNLMISFLHCLLKFFDPPKKTEVISENFHKSRSNVVLFSCQVLELSGEATRRETQRISRLGGVTKILVI